MGFLTDLIKKFPALSEESEKLSQTEARLAALEDENRRLREELAAARASAPDATADSWFVEGSGVLWKKKRTGGFESMPCCPTCRSTLSDYSGSLLCLKCTWQAPLKSFEVPKVYHDLFGQG